MSSISGVVLMAVTMPVSGCSMSSQNLPRAGNEAAPLINRSVLLKDAHGAVLGNVAETDAASVTVFTSKGYFVSLGWNGVPVDGTCWFTEAKGMGTPFFIALSTDKLFGFSVSVNGRVYVAATVDASGFAVSDPSITGFQSYYSRQRQHDRRRRRRAGRSCRLPLEARRFRGPRPAVLDCSDRAACFSIGIRSG